MNIDQFRAMVARLERDSAARPRAYLVRVALLALLGFGLIGLLVGVAGFGLVLIAAVAVAALATGGGAIIVLLKLGKLLALLAIPLFFLVRSALRALFVRLPAPQGEAVTRRQAPVLFDAIDTMRRRLHGPRVHQVLLVDEVNAAIVQRPLFGLFGFPRNYLLLGLPLLETMTPDEALAVVAHEYGHLAGSHGRFAAFIYRLRLTWGTVQAVVGQWPGWLGRTMGRAVGWYAPYFNAYTFVLARANEYQADRAAADLVGAPVMAAALKRVNVVVPQYQAFIGATLERAADEPQPPSDLAARWVAALAAPNDAVTRWLDEALQRSGDVTDTHPALRERLAALGAEGEASIVPPPCSSGASAAERWLGGHVVAVRTVFQTHWLQGIEQPWTQRHESIVADRARLAALRAQGQRSRDEEFERLRLSVQLEPNGLWLDELVAFNAAHADNPGGPFLEGSLRLDGGDESGLDALERAMVLDADAIKPACARAFAFWRERKDEARAESYAERWRERDALETGRQEQAARLDTAHELRPHELPEATMAQVRDLLARADRKGIAALYLVRRVLPADPAVQSYVLGVELTWWARQRQRQQATVKHLAAIEWPMHLFICTLDGKYARYGKKIKAVAGSAL